MIVENVVFQIAKVWHPCCLSIPASRILTANSLRAQGHFAAVLGGLEGMGGLMRLTNRIRLDLSMNCCYESKNAVISRRYQWQMFYLVDRESLAKEQQIHVTESGR